MSDATERTESEKRFFPANGWGFLLPPIVWALYFAANYSVQGAGCALVGEDGSPTVLRVVLASLALATATAILIFGIWSFRCWRELAPREPLFAGDHSGPTAFLAHGTLLNAALFLLATIWVGLPTVLLDPCTARG
jgi:hypothetical protein